MKEESGIWQGLAEGSESLRMEECILGSKNVSRLKDSKRSRKEESEVAKN